MNRARDRAAVIRTVILIVELHSFSPSPAIIEVLRAVWAVNAYPRVIISTLRAFFRERHNAIRVVAQRSDVQFDAVLPGARRHRERVPLGEGQSREVDEEVLPDAMHPE